MSEVERLREFAEWVITEGAFSGGGLDGGEIQYKAEALGLIRKEVYNPQIHGHSDYAEPGMDWFVLETPRTAANDEVRA